MPRTSQSSAERIVAEALCVDLVDGKGRFNLDSSRRAGTSGVFFDSACDAAYCVVDITGGDLAGLTGEQQIQLVRDLRAIGLRCTRLDVALDYKGEDVALVDGLEAWCRAGFLRGARTYVVHMGCSEGVLNNHGVSIGKRGNQGSGRFVRCYRKDLEQGIEGRWDRYEVEFSDVCARQAVDAICESKWPSTVVASCALGAIDFMHGDRDQRLDTHTRIPEWQEVIKDVECIRLTSPRLSSTLDSWSRWMLAAVIPGMLALGKIMGGVSASDVAMAAESNARASDAWASSGKAVAVSQALRHGVSGDSPSATLLRDLGVPDAQVLVAVDVPSSGFLVGGHRQVRGSVPTRLVPSIVFSTDGTMALVV